MKIIPSIFRPWDSVRQRGAALILTLAALVLMSILVLAFLSKATLGRRIAFSSAGQARAEWLAQTSLQTLVSDLKKEIVAGSEVDTQSNVNMYLPKSNRHLMPSKVGASSHVNLVKISKAGVPLWSGTGYNSTISSPVRALSGCSASAPSNNGRSIAANRWNKSYLLGDSSVPPDWESPDWVLITRQGPVDTANGTAPTLAQLTDAAPTNPLFAIGRYAYAIHDEGGLLDINVAGNRLSPGDNSRRGRMTGADLSRIPGFTASLSKINEFLQWRSPSASANPVWLYATPTNTFLNPYPNDQIFTSRQDLINYQKANTDVLSAAALQYLGTFSREKNAPTYAPPVLGSVERPRIQFSNSTLPSDFWNLITTYSSYVGNPYTYNTTNNENNFNPDFNKVRKSTGGKPVMTKRFPLSTLVWLTSDGPSASLGPADARYNGNGTATNIKKYYGLVWVPASGSWNYTSPDETSVVSNIKYLKDVPSTRDPDFFETLQAAINIGSLGRDSGRAWYYWQDYEPGSASYNRAYSFNTYFQIMQIGANIIDQSDPDSFPTGINFNNQTMVGGSENLPYPVRVYYTLSHDTANRTVYGWYNFELWNPYQNINQTADSSWIPDKIKITGSGSANILVYRWFGPQIGSQPGTGTDLSTCGQLEVNLSPGGFSGATLLNTTNTSTNNGLNYHATSPPLAGTQGIGINVGKTIYDASGGPLGYANLQPYSQGVSFQFYYKKDGVYRSYPFHTFSNIYAQQKENVNANGTYFYYLRVDPRTDRFGTSMNVLNVAQPDGSWGYHTNLGNLFVDNYAATGYVGDQLRENSFDATGVSGSSLFIYNNNTSGTNSINAALNSNYATLAENRASGDPGGHSRVAYRDPDGVIRWGDAALASNANGRALITGNNASKPIILNRPFRSVGELGYVFRDQPFKSLDFFSPRSADAALLDCFSIEDGELSAGRFNLNTRQKPVVEAILAGAAYKDDQSSSISASQAATLAGKLVDFTQSSASGKGPLLNRSELVTKLWNEISPSGTQGNIKTEREGVVRALAESGTTRTWNLFIDLIVQSGRYQSKATDLAAGFVVEGEKHYWLHVAIDRFTGEIIDQQIEAVYE
ncbi:MAG: hypothetical protein SFU85_03370 [Candidatus Methylacidiphilales bacterium]|nr:hypothetical protein [Candidatus Methylacidiphilales bacterium]